MTALKHTWPIDAFDGINIKAGECGLRLQGTDDDVVGLEGEVDEKRLHNLRLDISGRWLKIFIPHNNNSELILKLPGSKAWVTEIFAGKAEIEARGIRSRLQVMAGKGDIYIEGHTGALTVASGRSDIYLKHFVHADMPQPPPSPAPASYPESANRPPWDWLRWDENEWENWGHSLGAKIGWWALDFSRYFDGSSIDIKNAGLSIHCGEGDVELTDISAKTGLIRLSKGNLKLQEAQVTNLEVVLSHGNIEGQSLAPAGDWAIKNSHGNIHLSLSSNVSARLDMATSNGNIHSEIPLVRVTRQGPETYSGKRMVGTIGPKIEGTLPELRVVNSHGNIDIDSHSPESKYAAKPETDGKTSVPGGTPVCVSNNAMGLKEEAAANSPVDNTPQAILEALREGRISVTEAEQLLKSMSF